MIDSTFSTLISSMESSFHIQQYQDEMWIVRSPFTYSDGDSLPVFISRIDGRWALRDCGMTVSHLYFDEFEYSEARYRSIMQVADYHYAEISKEYEIIMPLDAAPTPYDIGDFLQLISQIQVVAIVSHTEREQRTYIKTIRESLRKAIDVSVTNLSIDDNWTCQELRSKSNGKYSIDIRIYSSQNGLQPVNMLLASTDYKTTLSIITMGKVRPFDEKSNFILAINPERVSEAAVVRFEDQICEEDSVVRVTPDNLHPLYAELDKRGIPILS